MDAVKFVVWAISIKKIKMVVDGTKGVCGLSKDILSDLMMDIVYQ